MVGRLCCSSVSARKEPIDIEALSDEVLLNILEQASKYEGHATMRGTFPLVCKRWKDAIYGTKGGSIFRTITLNYEAERCLANGGAWQPGDRQYALSVWAIARWIHKNIESGNIRYPLGFSAYSSDQKGEGTPVKGLDVLLAIMGEKLQGLGLHGQTGIVSPAMQLVEADAAALQDFRKELSEMRGRDILSLWCHGLLDV